MLLKSSPSKEFTALQIAQLIDAKVVGDSSTVITGADELLCANSKDISFYSNDKYYSQFTSSKASVIIIDGETEIYENKTFLIHPNPSLAFQTVLKTIFSDRDIRSAFKNIHPTAVIDPTAKIGDNVVIGPHVVIDREVVIDDFTRIDAGCVLYPLVQIGKHCHLFANVTVREEVIIKNRVILQPNCVIGGCGFGYESDPHRGVVKLEHYGKVILEDDVEIGSGTTIDRARFKATRIGRMTKVDNLVQIGHNVEIGMANFIVAQVGIAGSTKVGDRVQIGGQAGLNGHIHIASDVQIGAKSGVMTSIKEGGMYVGLPAGPAMEQGRLHARLKKLDQLFKRVDALENK
ncbi:MAG: UDP-3-O-(3-hydroxymyristoyl)glucosamine N-acyltransferase [Verrucomicrobia bacterium]|nr:UDP-3-O-(3-hydroxymyristoyl)glucosamine N-acyltransferase [Verrucomicrobiota bacterium]NDE63528.1 UDP-3-O-(3-hydroxymyristoyl)glucosamine N-acyltransferase [Chlamydiota bacterium]